MNPAEEVGRQLQMLPVSFDGGVQSQTNTTGKEMELVPGRILPVHNSSKASSSVSMTTDTESARPGPVGADQFD